MPILEDAPDPRQHLVGPLRILGVSLHALKRHAEAAGAAEKSASLSAAKKADALYLVACARAQQGKKADAITALEQSVAAGFKAKRGIERDPGFDPLRSEPRFQSLLARL